MSDDSAAAAPADDTAFDTWLLGFDAAADHLLKIGVDRAVVLELNQVLQVVNVLRMQALLKLRRDALDQALAAAPLVETA